MDLPHRIVREFNLAFRYKNAGTDDFRAVLERVTKKDWKPWFERYFYGFEMP